jgi:hypothetical protein
MPRVPRTRRATLLAAMSVLISAPLLAAEPPQPPSQPPQPAPAAGAPPTATSPSPPPQAGAATLFQPFTPSDRLSTGRPVAFPNDI